jgi:NADPH:quinone reductase-like Zn-dependent oxidoreductase
MAAQTRPRDPAGTPDRHLNHGIAFDRYGDPDVLAAVTLPQAVPGPGDLVVQVAAAGVNPADALLRAGALRRFARLRLPFVPGSDVAGVVAAVGAGVTAFRPGDPVYAMLPSTTGGGYARQVTVPAAHAAPAPVGLPLGDAAAVPLAGLTALQALRDRAGLTDGADLLINGASGGVGHLAVQIAVALGARVTAVTSGRNAEFVAGLGAAEVVDYQRHDPAGLGARFDVVFDAVNTLPFRRSRRLLRPGGTAVTVQPVAEKFAPDWLAWTRGGRRLRSVFVRPDGADLRTLADWIERGRLRPAVEHRYPLAGAVQAHRRIETRRVRGKLLLTVDPDRAATIL